MNLDMVNTFNLLPNTNEDQNLLNNLKFNEKIFIKMNLVIIIRTVFGLKQPSKLYK